MTAGKTIAAARVAQGLTNGALADLTGISAGHLSNLERGARCGSDEVLYPIACALGLDPIELTLRSGRLPDRFVALVCADPVEGAKLIRRVLEGQCST